MEKLEIDFFETQSIVNPDTVEKEKIEVISDSFFFEIEKSGRDDIITFEEISKNILHRSDVILNETWQEIQNVPSRILTFQKDIVSCECLVNKEKQEFQLRNFPSLLFEKLNSIEPGKLILIKLSSKPGSSRIDVFDGKGIVEERLFEMHDEWESLKESGLDNPLQL